MTKFELIEVLKDMGLRLETFSFYSNLDGIESNDVEFETCDISGEKGNVVNCTALDNEGNAQSIKVLDSLVHGKLGKLAGAF